ncbi:hypothetical protein PENTCL1PPCAC_14522, partial [Pristionchus entomophagus]
MTMQSAMYMPETNLVQNGMYKSVNMDVAPSAQLSGFDLPLDDIATLRFFFNLGVHQSRVVLRSQKTHDVTIRSPPASLPAVPVVPAGLNLQLQAIQAWLQLQLQR